MCCGAEIAMLIFGIITLVKGKFTLSRNIVVTGAPAYIIGVLLTGTLPVLFGIAFVIGIVLAANAHGQPVDASKFAFLDLVAVPLVMLVVLAIALLAPKTNAERQTPPLNPFPPDYPKDLPPMGGNPYASPRSDIGDGPK